MLRHRVADELNERRLAALAATGALGLEYVNRPAWARARGLPLAWQIPPAVKRKYRDIQHCVTSDATSGVFLPQSSSEWTTFNALNGWSNPAHLYLCQEASGNLADSIGSAALTASATAPLYHQAITGWSTLAVGTTNATLNQRFSSTAMVDISTTSMLAVAYLVTGAAPASALGYLTFGTTTNYARFALTATPRYQVSSTSTNNTTGTAAVPLTTVVPHVLQVDRANNVVRGYTLAEVLTPTFGSGMTGNQISLGATINGSQNATTLRCLYLAVWTGSAAEKSQADVKNLVVQLGNTAWTPAWTVGYSAALAETDNLAESLAAVVQVSISFSDSESVDESMSASYAANASLTDSESVAESMSAQTTATINLADSASVAESMSAAAAVTIDFADDAALDESLSAQVDITIPLTDSAAISESMTGILHHPGTSGQLTPVGEQGGTLTVKNTQRGSLVKKG